MTPLGSTAATIPPPIPKLPWSFCRHCFAITLQAFLFARATTVNVVGKALRHAGINLALQNGGSGTEETAFFKALGKIG